MDEPDKNNQSATLEELKKQLSEYQKLLEDAVNEYNAHLAEITELRRELHDHKAAVESRIERISDVLVTNISHLRAIVDNIAILSERIGDCEQFITNHGHEYTKVLDRLTDVEDDLETGKQSVHARVDKMETHFDTMKKDTAKEIGALKEHDETQSKYHWKLGVIVTVACMALAIVLRVGTVQELLIALFDWLTGK